MADLYGTYDKRIKFTIDNTKIDATLTWIPITVLLTSTAGEEVFVELDADSDFDKCAFTKSDGTTELYADCELYDVSGEVAIYHVSLDGWEIASGTDTDFYMYYDDDASPNTSKISMSGGTAAQSVYDANFKAVYHMNDIADANIVYDTQYEAAVEPDSDGWTLVETDYSSVSAGILTIDTSANDNLLCSYYKTPDIDFDAGFYFKTKVKASTDMNTEDDYLTFDILDGTQNEKIRFAISDAGFYSTNSVGNFIWVALDTTTDYVVYELYVKDNTYWFYADGVEKVNTLIYTQVGTDVVQFGDISPTKMCKAEIDYVYYALGVTDNPLLTILDSTSNNNDGTKKGLDEPVEATGKVGQGQDFDGTDDRIGLTDPANGSLDFGTGDFSIFNLMKTTAEVVQNLISKQGVDPRYYFKMAADGTLFPLIDDGTTTLTAASTNPVNDGNWYWVGATFDRNGDMQCYINGATDGAGVAISTASDTLDNNNDFAIGWNGVNDDDTWLSVIDETRISSTLRSAAWIKATYNTLYDTLLTYGDEETSGVVVDNAIFFGCNF